MKYRDWHKAGKRRTEHFQSILAHRAAHAKGILYWPSLLQAILAFFKTFWATCKAKHTQCSPQLSRDILLTLNWADSTFLAAFRGFWLGSLRDVVELFASLWIVSFDNPATYPCNNLLFWWTVCVWFFCFVCVYEHLCMLFWLCVCVCGWAHCLARVGALHVGLSAVSNASLQNFLHSCNQENVRVRTRHREDTLKHK